jgi:hypothetical protein
MDNQLKPAKPLFNCLLRCHVCLRLLAITHGIEKIPGVKINYSACPLHPKGDFHVDWEPVEDLARTWKG